ncbi:unnamed protein product [Arctia plantaginis]|uniref:Uncharacterized protein n=1 Tax=Arctia plantaginis TaxID=874455 RepID=A0A8S1BPP4_ARCPL|nr:unnamed protein product [Arctia plantaginis]
MDHLQYKRKRSWSEGRQASQTVAETRVNTPLGHFSIILCTTATSFFGYAAFLDKVKHHLQSFSNDDAAHNVQSWHLYNAVYNSRPQFLGTFQSLLVLHKEQVKPE